MPSPSGSTPVLGLPYLLETDAPDVATASEDLALAVEDAIALAWTSYTPTWTGGSPTIGNGTLLGKYNKVGKTCSFRITLAGGSTTTVGSGPYTLGLPFNAVADGTFQLVEAFVFNATVDYSGYALIGSGGGTVSPAVNGGSNPTYTPVGSTFFGNNDLIVVQGTYETA